MNKKNITREEQILSSGFYSYTSSFNADLLVEGFIERANSNEIKLDGSDPFLRLLDEYVLVNNTSRFKYTIDKSTTLYRARIVHTNNMNNLHYENGKLFGYSESESREAPLGLGGVGRNNIAGMSYLYLADSMQTACCEVKPIVRQLLSVASFTIKMPLAVIDFTIDSNRAKSALQETVNVYLDDKNVVIPVKIGEVFEKVARMFYRPITDTKEYKATQVLTDYIRKTGIDGVRYNSFYNEKGINYTIFNSDRRKIHFDDSRIVMLQSERRTFLDFNNERTCDAKTIGSASYNSISTSKLREQIITQIKDGI